jgi:beta-glucosidase
MTKNTFAVFFCAFFFAFLVSPSRADAPGTGFVPNAVYANSTAPAEARVSDLLARLTQPEKLSLMALIGYGDPYKLDLPAIPRLGIGSLRTIDAPEGLRDGPASAFPMEVVLASSWNPELVRQVGAAVGQEARAKNRQIVYGPDVNIQRTPQGGRYFECFSEDPYVNAQMATAYIDGMQSQKVASCIKHFICNDQETDRHDINVAVDERTLREIYLPVFDAAIHDAHVWALMPALGRVNGEFCAQNKPLLGALLQTQWGWDGLAVSDWGSVHTTAATLIAGTDVEMPQPDHFSPAALTDALTSGQITQAEIDDAVRRVLRLMLRTGMLDAPKPVSQSVVNSPAHQALARKAALQGITLLKNTNHFLPLPKTIKSVAVIGPNAADTQLGGRWSAEVKPFYQISILDGIKKKLGPKVAVSFEQGCPRTRVSTPGSIERAVALAKTADAAIVVVGTDNNYEGEELDPPDLHLPGDQEKLIEAVAAANPHTLVVLNCGTPLQVSHWLPRVPGLLETWYSGQEAGNAAADIIFGDADPSGKLTGTWANARDEYSDWGNYPGAGGFLRYMEGVYVGYRHFDQAKIAPLFPFGYGLSYTTFAYSRLQAPSKVRAGRPFIVRVSVTNTGKRAGDEIAECYVRPLHSRIDRPVRELKAFARVSLLPGETKTVAMTLGPNAFAYWDTRTHGWKTDSGAYGIDIGASSRDIRLSETVQTGYTPTEVKTHAQSPAKTSRHRQAGVLRQAGGEKPG